MPHIKGESYTDFNSSYVYVYTDYLPVEFFCNGIISACLTFINVMCIFITAIIVLKVIRSKVHLLVSFYGKTSSITLFLDQGSSRALYIYTGIKTILGTRYTFGS